MQQPAAGDIDGAGAERTRGHGMAVGSSLEHQHGGTGARQLERQSQSHRTAAGDDHIMFVHGDNPEQCSQ